MSEKDSGNLEFATTDELVDELRKRCSAFVIGIDLKVNKEGTFYTETRGDVLLCSGLVARLKMLSDERLLNATANEKSE